MRFIVLAALLPLVAGCDSLMPGSGMDIASADDASCRDYGFQPGTDGYASCRLQLDLEHRETDRDKQREIRDGLLAMSENLQGRRGLTSRRERNCTLGGFRSAC